MPKFKVLRGKHREGGKTYGPGEIVDSKTDLTKHNSPGSIKFQRAYEFDAPPEPEPESSSPEKPLDQMTMEELRAYAAAEEITLEGARSKADIVARISESIGTTA